jgi:integrase/recombinase XerD
MASSDRTFVLPSIPDSIQPGDTESRLIEMWVHGLSPQTQDRYRRTARRFLAFANKPLHAVTLADLQGWQNSMARLSQSSQRTAIATIKSLVSFGHKIGVLSENVGLSMRSPKAKDCLHERILSEQEVRSMIAQERSDRNRVILLLLYASGLRVSELCQLKWKDLKPRGNSGLLTVLGKGSKTGVLQRLVKNSAILTEMPNTSAFQ